MGEKYFVKPEELLRDSYELGKKIVVSGYQPNFIAAIWRGGTPVGIAVQELLKHCGIITDHIAIRTMGYDEDRPKDKVTVDSLEYLVKKVNFSDRLLIIDDVYDTGRSIDTFIRELGLLTRANMPRDVKVATVYFKPANNLTTRVPDFYVHQTDQWVVFPHELDKLSEEEIRQSKGEEAYKIIKEALASLKLSPLFLS